MATIYCTAGHKGRIMVLETEINQELAKGIQGNTAEIQALLEQVTGKRHMINQLYDSIINNLTDSEEITRFISEQSNYDVKVSKLLLGVQAALTPLPTQSATVSQPTKAVKLPVIQLPSFDGDVVQWLSFWEQFRTSVHERTELETVTKFNYLRSVLKGSAYKLIENFATIPHSARADGELCVRPRPTWR